MATYLITGANRGIGYEYCRQIKERGDMAIAVCRTAATELRDLGVQVEEGIDITSDASVVDLCDRLARISHKTRKKRGQKLPKYRLDKHFGSSNT